MNLIFPNRIYHLIICVLVSVIIATPFFVINTKYNLVREDVFVQLMFFITCSICLTLFYSINKKRNSNPKLKLILNRKEIPLILFCILFLLGVHIVYFVINTINKNTNDSSSLDYLMILGAIIMAPIFEELIFRQYFLSGLLSRNKPLIAIIINSIFFGLIHIQLHQIIIGFIFGLLFSYIFYKTQKIGITMVLHCIANSFAFIVPLTLNNISKSINLHLNDFKYVLISIGMVFIYYSTIQIKSYYNSDRLS